MQSVTETLASLKITGLSDYEAKERLQKYGFNELETEKKHTFLGVIKEVMTEPMFIFLLVCGIVYFLIGDINEGLMILASVIFMIGLTIYQQNKTESAVEALKDLSSPRALVVREGESKRIAGREVAFEDIVILSEGDRVPADCIVIECSNLNVDESLLTGESVTVRKVNTTDLMQEFSPPGGDGLPFVYSGTLVVSGVGIVQVKKTAMNTEMGKIGKSLKEVKTEKSLLEKETAKIVKIVSIAAVILCLIVVFVYGSIHGNWLESILTGVTIAISVLPEEFTVVLTVFLALGAWHMSKKNVLTRKNSAIQALGSATVLCSDKTGTLTLNKMTLKAVYSENSMLWLGKKEGIPSEFHETIEYGILASQKETFDPMEKALIEVGNSMLAHTHHIHKNWHLLREYPLSPELLSISHAWDSPDKKENIVAAKGAPESIIDLCHLKETEKKKILEKAAEFSKDGLRVIGVAKAEVGDELPADQHDFKFTFVGLLGFEDPIRPGINAAIKECYSAGIRVIMITGDYPGTATNIAKQIGLQNYSNHISGHELSTLSDDELRKRINEVNVFARIMPEQKLRIVKALKANGEIVAMTGDGVNDSPALKAAHIGIAMGQRGTDVAREASSLVITDDDFVSIVGGIRLGRRIFDNIRKAMAYVLAVHIPIAGVALVTVLLDWPLILLPVHVVFLELIIDPACSIVFEAENEEKNVMRRKPRDPKEKIFNKNTLVYSTLQGVVVLIVILFIFNYKIQTGASEDVARAMGFSILIMTNLFLILTNRSWSMNILETFKDKNPYLWFIVGGALTILLLALNVPFLQEIFKFGQLTFADFGLILFAAALSVFWFEIIKMLGKYKFIPSLT